MAPYSVPICSRMPTARIEKPQRGASGVPFMSRSTLFSLIAPSSWARSSGLAAIWFPSWLKLMPSPLGLRGLGGCGSVLVGVFANLERGSTSAGGDDVRVVDGEAGALQAHHVVDLGPEDELHRHLVNDHRHAVVLEDVVVFLALVEGV